MSVRTRFAPSPTGYLHIGGARTALFCWLYARRHGGTFVLRVEDTDRVRSTDASVQAILDGLSWLGLRHDEGPVFQTERFDRYREVVQHLLDSGCAYHCYCTTEELEAMRETARAAGEKPRYNGYWRDRSTPPPTGVDPVVRFRNPLEGTVEFDDAVKGRISVANSELDDLVIMRSDGTPTYNLTVVVDDMDMNISHVIRGDDHVNNTPRQINILMALGARMPVYAHLPMILGHDGKRLSKRHGAVSVLHYEAAGYLPEAVLNYLCRLGWSYGDQELFSIEEMIEHFSLEAVNRAGAVFDQRKLDWVNQQHLQQVSAERLEHLLAPRLAHLGVSDLTQPSLADVMALLRERAVTLEDLAVAAQIFYHPPAQYEEKAARKHLVDTTLPLLECVRDALDELQEWNAASVQSALDNTVAVHAVGFGKLGLPLRVAVTGSTASPPIDQTLSLIGKRAVVSRIDTAVRWIKAR